MKLTIATIAIIGSLIFFFACSKDSYKTKPTLKIESVSSYTLSSIDTLSVKVQMTDKQGDFPDGIFFSRAIRLNEKPVGNGGTDEYVLLSDTLKGYNFDRDYPKTIFERRYAAQGYLHKPSTENDTIQIYFTLRDRAGNQSDTVYTDKIVVLK